MKAFRFFLSLSFLFVGSLLYSQTFNGTTGAIPDNNTEKCFTATVSGLSGNMNPTKGLAKVCVNITHSWGMDLDVFLVTPNGERIMLSTDNNVISYSALCFTPDATYKITEGIIPADRNVLGEDCYAFLNNNTLSGNGTWKLCITDDESTFDGKVNSWSLTFDKTTALECGKNPIARDRCPNATEICTLDGYCGNTSRCYTPDIPGNLGVLFEQASAPKAVEIHNNSWLTFVASAATVDLAIDVSNCQKSDTNGVQIFITSTQDCQTFAGNYGCYPQIVGKDTIQAKGLIIGKKYYVMIDGGYGDVCDYKLTAVSGIKTVAAKATSPTICLGASSTLNATTAGTSPNITYTWASNPPGTSGTGPNLTVKPTTTTTYTVSITDCNTILTATTQVTVNPLPTVSVFSGSSTICSGNTTTLTATATFGDEYKWYDAGGNILHTGATYNTPVLASNTTYYVQATSSMGCTNTAKTPVTVTVNTTPTSPVVAGMTVICSGTATTLTATAPGGTYKWYDAATGGTLIYTGPSYTTPVLNASTTYYVEVESSARCTSKDRTAVPVTVHTTPVSPAVTGPTTICSGNNTTLTAVAPGGGTYQWYDVATGGTPLTTNAVFTTPVLNANKTYYVEVISTASCVSTGRTPVNITVNTTPVSPVVTGTTTICSGNKATLTATAPGGTYKWFDVATGGNLLYTGNNYVTPVLSGTVTYYVEVESIAGCTSVGRTPVTVTVHTTPILPVVTGPATICSGNKATLTATSPGGTYKWYESASGGSPIFTGDSYTTVVLNSTKTYYVEVESVAACTSVGRTPVTVTVHTTPVSPVVTGPTTICSGSTTMLTAVSPGGAYKWYDAAKGGTLLFTGPSYITPVLTANKTYYVEVESQAACTSVDRTVVTVTVNPLPSLPVVVLPDSICKNTQATLTATAPGGTYKWFDAPTGGNLLYTGTVYMTAVLSQSQTFYVEGVSVAGCTSPSRTPVTVKVSQISAEFASNPTKGSAPLKVDFTNLSSGAVAYHWDFGDQSAPSTDPNPTHTYSKKGEGATIVVTLIATSSFGCTDTATMTIEIDPFSKLIVPNVFTPNNDDVNDLFKVESIGLNFVKAELYSRWGTKVYEWNTVHEGWDGRTTSGVEAPQGTYFYMIIAKGVDGKDYEFKGHFTLLR